MRSSSVQCIRWTTLNSISDNPWSQGTHHCCGLCSWWTISCHLLKHRQPHFLLAGKWTCCRVLTCGAWSAFAGKGSLVPSLPSFNRYQVLIACRLCASCQHAGATENTISNLEGGGLLSPSFQSEGDTSKSASNYSTGEPGSKVGGPASQRQRHLSWDTVTSRKSQAFRVGRGGCLERGRHHSDVSEGLARKESGHRALLRLLIYTRHPDNANRA